MMPKEERAMVHSADTASRIALDIDFAKDGRQASYLRAPLSRNTSGWGTIEIPIFVLRNGDGPTALFTGGIHGDEYEGQIACSRLAQDLDSASIRGRVIIMPAVNMPAVLANTRLSPVDNRDINRCFPGDPRGTFSEMLAHFLDNVILPHVDVSVDLHTAGHSMESAPSTNMHYLPGRAARERTMAAATAFGAPFNVVFWGVDEGATFTSAVERRGILSLGTELGGWGRVNVEGVRIAERGVRNILRHVGLTPGAPETCQRDATPATRHMMVRDRGNYTFAPAAGLFEPRHLAAQPVEQDGIAGYLHFIEDVDRPPLALRYGCSGVLWMAAGPGRVQRGDVLVVVMTDYDDAAAAR
jgi:N-alpha-acetyl-L-2,4-diaminobutyrate deacetylase